MLPVHALAQLGMGIPPLLMLINFAGNSGDALLAALAIGRAVPEPRRYDQLRAVTAIVVFGALLAPALASFAVASVFAQMGVTTSLWMSWRLRLLTNALAVITLVPPVTLLAQRLAGLPVGGAA